MSKTKIRNEKSDEEHMIDVLLELYGLEVVENKISCHKRFEFYFI